MSSTALNNLGLNYLWLLAEDGWKTGMDTNLIIADTMAQAGMSGGVGVTSPPGSPAQGFACVVGVSATGAFSGKDNQIAVFYASAYTFITPEAGWLVFDRVLAKWWVYDGSVWTDNIRKFFANTVKSVTASTYSPVLADIGALVQLSDATGVALSVPLNSSIAFPIGTEIQFAQVSAGKITVTGISGVTVLAAGSKVKTAAQESVAFLKKVAVNTWRWYGDIST